MYRSLLLLSWLRAKGQLRKLRQAVSTPRGILMALLGAAFFSLMFLPYLMTRGLDTPVPKERMYLMTWFLHPAALLVLWAFSILGGHFRSPIAFSLPEVEFLFPGPFQRRQLLIYKLAISTIGTLGFALLMPLVMPMLWAPAALVGIWLALTFMQWSTIFLAVAGSWLGTRYRLVLVSIAAALIVVVGLSAYRSGVFEPDVDWRDRARAFESSGAVKTLLAPFGVFSKTIGAKTYAELLAWAPMGLGMTLLVAGGVLALDRHFMEASLDASRRRADMLAQFKRTGGLPMIGARSRPRVGLMDFPRLGGAGPIAWRQALDMIRGSSRIVFLLLIMAGPLSGVLLAATRREGGPGDALVVAVTMVIGLLVTTIMPLGLRTDLDHIDVIKTLPIRARTIVWGSLGGSLLYVLFLQLLAVAAMAAALGTLTPVMAGALALALPINLLTIACDSALVLVFPSIRRFAPGDLLVGVRVALVNFAKVMLALLAGAIAGTVLVGGRLLLPDLPAAYITAAWLVLVLEGLVTLSIVVLLFKHYDPSENLIDAE
jgi:hypothetical protein